MKTKDFIKLLQKEDPSGECHIRLLGGIPIYAERKEGYWDGPYDYIDEKKRWVHSIKDSKIDIICQDTEDFVSSLVYAGKTWEEIKDSFIFELNGYSSDSKKRRKEEFMNNIKEHYDFMVILQEKNLQESIDLALKRVNAGWNFYQNKKVDDDNHYFYYFWQIYDSETKTWKTSSIRDTNGILNSGLFEKIDNNELPDHYSWVLKKLV